MSQFTKKAIIDAFITLISDHPLDKITIKDIVTECGINRNTFYYYYQDIYDLVDDIFKIETQKIVGESIDYKTWQEAFLKAVDFVYNNKKGIYHIYKSISRELLENYLNKVTYNNMISFIKSEVEGLNAQECDIELIASFYSHALVGLSLKWLNDGMKEDIKEYINRLGYLFEGNIKYCFTKNKQNTDK